MFRLLRRLIGAPVKSIAVRLLRRVEDWANEDLPRFANTPIGLTIERPRRIFSPDRMYIGNDVHFGPGAFLVAQTTYPTEVMQDPSKHHEIQRFEPRIYIGHRVTSSGGLTIAALGQVTIEDDVMMASNVYISDGQHGFQNANEPFKYQRMWRIAPVLIRRGCWIGQNVVITSGVTIGEFSIIGANSVVTKSIPAHSIAVGSPARVVKTWDDSARRWVSTSPGT